MKQILIILLMLVNSSSYETQKYELIVSEDEFEIRFYPAALKAKVISTREMLMVTFTNYFNLLAGTIPRVKKLK